MLLYPIFFRRYGVRRWTELASPRIAGFQDLLLPKESFLHYVPKSELEYGIEPSDPIVALNDRQIFVDHARDLLVKEGGPVSNRIPADTLVRRYAQRYRRFRRLRKMETAIRDPHNLAVMNYGLLNHLYRYRPSIYANYNRWANIQTTVWLTVEQLVKEVSERNHFIVFELPSQLPTLAEFRKAEANISRSTLAAFKGPRSLTLLDFWIWLGETRERSKMAGVSVESMDKINVIFTSGTRWTLVNLGWLNRQRDPSSDASADNEVDTEDRNPLLVQKHFLRSMMALFETNTVLAPSRPGDDDDEEEADEQEEQEEEQKLAQSGDSEENKKVIAHRREIKESSTAKKTKEKEYTEAELDEILNELEKMRHKQDALMETAGIDPEVDYKPVEPESIVETQMQDLAEQGLLSGADYRRLEKALERTKEIASPFSEGTLEEFVKIEPEDLKLEEDETVLTQEIEGVSDQQMLKSSVSQFEPKYIKNLMKKDIASMVLASQAAGAMVSDYKVREVKDAINHYEMHSVRLTPVVGAPSTVHFRLPVVKEDGTYIANGVKYRMRNQRSDLPIRKVAPNRVALTSYYGKVFVERSERVTNNYDRWITSRIIALGLDSEDDTISRMRLTETFDHTLTVPRTYSAISKRIVAFMTGDYEFFFDYHTRKDVYGESNVEEAEADGMLVVGKHKRTLLLMDSDSIVYLNKTEGPETLGRVEDIIGLEALGQPPLETADLKLFNKSIPVGLALGHLMGIDRLIERLGVEPRRVAAGGRLDLTEDEFVVRFKDESLIFPRSNALATLVFSGFNRFHRDVRNYSYREYNRKPVYANVLESNGMQVRYVRELNLLESMFIDPITLELLQQMNEPVTFIGLLFRSCELLLTDWHPEENNMEYQRIRGYERFSGAVYAELVRAMRAHNAKPASPNKQISLNPEAVWMSIAKDPAQVTIEDSNPLQNLRHKEELTFSGTGGRSNESMVARTRVYHPNDMGVVSESTKDSGDVAITTFLSPDANITSLRGLTGRFDKEKEGATKLMSTSALLAPAADRDDPKRVNFIAIQQAQGISARGYVPSPLRTGYERVVAHRTDDLFAYTAKQDGRVVDVDESTVTLEYKDGEVVRIEIGRRFGDAAGTTYAHSVVSAVKKGQRVKEGDIVTFNENFFELDPIDPKQAVWKAGVIVRTALAESPDTLEDSSAISQKVAEAIITDSTEVRDIVVSFDQIIHNLAKVGDEVDSESILCNVENPVTSDNKLFDEETLDTLQLLSMQNPRAKKSGVVERIEVFYNGDKADMSESLRRIVNVSDREMMRRTKALDGQGHNGRVDNNMRIRNNPLELDNALIRVYITGPSKAGPGDKAVFGNQLKTIFGRVMEGVNESEDGEAIDAIFGYRSISDRLVNSSEIMGTTISLLKTLTKQVVKKYRE